MRRGSLALAFAAGAGCLGPDISLGIPAGADDGAADSDSDSDSEEDTNSLDDGGSASGDGADGDPLEACGLPGAAFCETFSTAHPGGRGGEIDESRWSFTRWAHAVQYMWLRLPARTRPDHLYPATFCGAPFSDILPGQDVRVCDGQLQEVFDDQGATALHSMRIRQPFDFADRTGTLVWDVDAKVNPHSIGHGWWIEVWITEDPAPMPHTELTVVSSYPRRGIGLSFASGGPCESTAEAWGNSLETVFVTNDDLVQSVFDDVGWDTPETRCFRAMDGQLNHFELRLSTDRLELEVTNFDDPDGPRSFVTVESLALPFSRGYVHLEHVQFSAAQDGLEGCEEGVPNTCPTPSQTFRWDNVAFDGPVLPTPRAYDVPEPGNIGPENEGAYVGWPLWDGSDLTVTFPDVDLEGVVAAGLGWTVLGANGQVYEYRLNEGAWHTSVVPDGPEATATLRGYSVALDLGELVVGSNTLDVRAVDPGTIEGVGNIDLTLELEE